MFLLSTGATLLGLLLVTGTAAITSLRTGLFGRWFAAASILLAVLSLAGATTIGYGSDAIQAVAGIALLLDSIWIAVAGALVWRATPLSRSG